MEDVYGREYWKQILLGYLPDEETDEALGIGSVRAVLLYGPAAAGKSLLLDALAGEAAARGYRYLALNLREDSGDRLGKVLPQVGDLCLPEGPVFLFLEHIADLEDAGPLVSLALRAAENGDSLLLAAAADEIGTVNADIRRLFTCHRVELPDRREREAYFAGVFSDCFAHESRESLGLLADGSEGFDYVQLNSLAVQVKMRVKAAVRSGEETAESAFYILKAGLVRDVLERTGERAAGRGPEKASPLSAEDVRELLSSLSAPQETPAAAAPSAGNAPAAEEEKRKITVNDFRSKYAVGGIFDQEVSLTE